MRKENPHNISEHEHAQILFILGGSKFHMQNLKDRRGKQFRNPFIYSNVKGVWL